MVFIVPPKVHLLDLSGPAHVFYEAKQLGAPLELLFVSLRNELDVESSAGLFFSNLITIDHLDIRPDDFVFVPGSEDILSIVKANRHFLERLRQWHAVGINICSICVGLFWLAEAGIIKEKKSTTHWKYINQLKQQFPETVVQDDHLFVIENNLFMSAGVTAGIDLSLHIIETLFDYDLTIQISKEIVYYFRRAGGDPQLSKFLKYRNHIDTRIHEVQDYIMNHLNEKFTLDDIAAAVNMSKRNMSRKFKKATQLTVGEYTSTIRIERAKHLLAKGNKLQAVAFECGYKSINQLKSILKKEDAPLP